MNLNLSSCQYFEPFTRCLVKMSGWLLEINYLFGIKRFVVG